MISLKVFSSFVSWANAFFVCFLFGFRVRVATMKDRENDGNLDNRIFVGGLSWDVTERQLEDTFERYGKIIECQVYYRISFFAFAAYIER